MEAIVVGAILLILAIVLAPFAGSALRRAARHRRRKLVDSPRKISILAEHEAAAAECAERGHRRDGTKVRHDGDGGYVTVCRRCGIRLARSGPGEWHPLDG